MFWVKDTKIQIHPNKSVDDTHIYAHWVIMAAVAEPCVLKATPKVTPLTLGPGQTANPL